MKIIDAQHIMGRGSILICEYNESLHYGDTIEIDKVKFEVRGIETFCPHPILMGVVIQKQDDVESFIGKNIVF